MTEDLTPTEAAAEQATAEEQAPITLYTFANHNPAPELESLLAMFYKGAVDNRLGIMQAKNTVTDEEQLLLVGVTVEEGNTQCYPLCVLLKAEDVPNYRAPDGNGGWFGEAVEGEAHETGQAA
jgi:hypothetical protein